MRALPNAAMNRSISAMRSGAPLFPARSSTVHISATRCRRVATASASRLISRRPTFQFVRSSTSVSGPSSRSSPATTGAAQSCARSANWKNRCRRR
jgi:hypothetical protein